MSSPSDDVQPGAYPCPCGLVHEPPARWRQAYATATGGKPPSVKLQIGGRAWMVPRIYIAVHGVKAAELPGLATRLGFAEVQPTAD